ncbi:MAG: transglycosylase domain-containing protein, partial [Nitrospinota bacterium]|nr:transglycosylase domain-containing protein [Nitrospinota bacterium]
MKTKLLRHRRPFLFWSVGVFSMATGVVLGLLFAMYSSLPALDKLEEYRPNVVTRIADRNGQVFHELYREKRFWVRYQDIPDVLRNAIVAVEDDQFFGHKGVRLTSILRALIADIRHMSLAQGGSTITQQLTKVLFLTPEKSFSRKIKEALLAIELEKRYTKKEILEFYCNQIYLGSGAYGVEAASRIYFGKSVGELNLPEAALLAGLPQRPSRYSPLKNPNAALTRRATVLSRMREVGYIDRKTELAAVQEPLRLADTSGQGPSATHFVELIRAGLLETFGESGLYLDGLTVTTTLDIGMQEAAEKAVADGLAIINEQEEKAGVRHDGAPVQAGMVVIDVRTGQVLAMVGSSDFSVSQFNHATMAHRQPGSAFKPFVYLAALEKGYTPASVLVDSPVS